MSQYSKQSPYSKSKITGDYLNLMTPRYVVQDPTDESFTITSQYDMRPDLLAYELYGNSRYWWIFSMRNKDELIDPIQDFKTGTTIKLPKLDNVR
jgi:hypothetical protein|tara:strand:- start:1912 stop:2196 length:285 start_codon:yes stop_codon:yes gene_type:complete